MGFEGYFFKHQAGGETLSLIPGVFGDEAFLQVIGNEFSYYIPYQRCEIKNDDSVRVGKNVFSRNGVELDVDEPELKLGGQIEYSNLMPLSKDIMGPFRHLRMECRHGIISMRHDICGEVRLNDREMVFDGGRGYIEKDSGRTFPRRYAWLQCSDFSQELCVTASIAVIPFARFTFTGVICAILYRGREYNLSTYNGGRAVLNEAGRMEIHKGKLRFTAIVALETGHELRAPASDGMTRAIVERPCCSVRAALHEGGEQVFDLLGGCAGYEYA